MIFVSQNSSEDLCENEYTNKNISFIVAVQVYT